MMEFVSWDDDIPNIWKNNETCSNMFQNLPNHQKKAISVGPWAFDLYPVVSMALWGYTSAVAGSCERQGSLHEVVDFSAKLNEKQDQIKGYLNGSMVTI